MQGRRRDNNTLALEHGDYAWGERHEVWFCCPPRGAVGSLADHTVTEHEDGTITVSPSILMPSTTEHGNWHGYLEHGIWREV